MKLAIALSFVLSGVVFGAGCKTDNVAPTESSSETSGAAADQAGPKGRSAKINPGPGGNRPTPHLDDDHDDDDDGDEPTDADREARRAEREARREERREERMKQLDKDGNGELSEEEIAQGRKQRAEEMRSRMDKDGDGKVTVEELSDGRMGRRLDPASVDTDKNGDVSAEELQAGMQQMRERMRAMRGSGGGPGDFGGGRWGGMGRRNRDGGSGAGSAK